VGIARHDFIQELPEFGTKALVGEMYEDISLCMSDIEGAHEVIILRLPLRRQEIA
jgi:hypothetical protein